MRLNARGKMLSFANSVFIPCGTWYHNASIIFPANNEYEGTLNITESFPMMTVICFIPRFVCVRVSAHPCTRVIGAHCRGQWRMSECSLSFSDIPLREPGLGWRPASLRDSCFSSPTVWGYRQVAAPDFLCGCRGFKLRSLSLCSRHFNHSAICPAPLLQFS